MRIIILACIMLAAAACGKSGGAKAVPSKELFSVWTETPGSFVLDLTSGSFGMAMNFALLLSGGEICDCQFSLLGTQASGSWTMAACTYRNGTGGGVDPGCAGANSNGTYTNSAATLSVCETGQPCETYR